MSLNPRITDWRGKSVWIVGASSGIGHALARSLLASGAKVTVSARRAEALQSAIAGYPDGMALPLDVNDATGFSGALEKIMSRFGGLDLAIFCAGAYYAARAWSIEPERARDLIETNVIGVMRGVAAVVPQFTTQGHGAIAIVASVAGYCGLPNALVYGASKAALINFSETLYMDLRPRGVAVTLINPGFVSTPLTAGNAFEMPALITPERAAQYILDGFAKGKFEIHFPRRFSGFLKLLQHLPRRWYFALLKPVVKRS